jgi:hypothetical protein
MAQHKRIAKNRNQQFANAILSGVCNVETKTFSVKKGLRQWIGTFFQIIGIISKWFVLIWRTLFTSFYNYEIWEGIEQSSMQGISIAFIGDSENGHYFKELIFKKNPKVTAMRGLYGWQLKKKIHNNPMAMDMTIVDIQFPVTIFFRSDGMLHVPRWVKQRISIDSDWEKVEQGIRHKVRKEVRRVIRKYGYQTRIVHGKKAAAFFYERIYRPFILHRYGAEAFVVSQKKFLRECRHGQILELLRDDNVVAASLIRKTGSQLSVVWTGVNIDLDDKEHAGASDVLDYFSLCYAHQCGCSYLDLGPSRARLNDGLLRYKKKWGAALYTGKIPQGQFLIIPHNFSIAVQAMLAEAKFITLENGRFVARVPITKDKILVDLEKQSRQDWVDGLDLLYYFVWHPTCAIKATKKCNIKVISFMNSDDAPLNLFCRSSISH